MPDKSEFKKKSQIHNLIRKAFNDGMEVSDLTSVKGFVDKINTEYDLKPETLAYVVQSVNRYALANEFRKSNQEQVYPKIDLVNVIDFCKQYGYSNIYTTINDELSFKFSKLNNEGKTAAKHTYNDYATMKKAASLNDKEREFNEDKTMSRINNFAYSKKAHLVDEMVEVYWQTPNIERFIKAASLDTSVASKELIDKAREQKVFTSAKYAGKEIDGFNKIMNLINEIKKLDIE